MSDHTDILDEILALKDPAHMAERLGPELGKFLDYSGLARRCLSQEVDPSVNATMSSALRVEFDPRNLDRSSLSCLFDPGVARLSQQEDVRFLEEIRHHAERRVVDAFTSDVILDAVSDPMTRIVVGIQHLLILLQMQGNGFTLAPSHLLGRHCMFFGVLRHTKPVILPLSPIVTMPKGMLALPWPSDVGRMILDGHPSVRLSDAHNAWLVTQNYRLEIKKDVKALRLDERAFDDGWRR